MQYLLINRTDTLQDISKIIGRQNTDLVLHENDLKRSPKIGEQYYQKYVDFIRDLPNEYGVSGSRKAALLNALTGNEEAFEKACMLDEKDWAFFSAYQSFPDAIKVPESVILPYSDRVLGSNIGNDIVTIGGNGIVGHGGAYITDGGSGVPSPVYKKVMASLKVSDNIDPEIFNSVNVSSPVGISNKSQGQKLKGNKFPQFAFNIPWGKIQLYSSILNETIDFPVYPEDLETERSASYTTMPDLIYQYEPWVTYQSSGPREQTVEFHMHRDLWSGNHLDGKANELIRFCEANTFPRYNGSSVNAPTVRLYIAGKLFISGVLTRTRTTWSGPIGLDEWYLEFKLGLTIQEVSETALNIDSVRKFGLIGV